MAKDLLDDIMVRQLLHFVGIVIGSLLLIVNTLSSFDLVLIVRPRSRNTYGFLPRDTWLLPQLELRSLLGDELGKDLTFASTPSERIFRVCHPKLDADNEIESVDLVESLVSAVGGSILIHSILDVIGQGSSKEEAVLSLEKQIPRLISDISCSLLHKPYVPKEEAEEILSHFRRLLETNCALEDGDSMDSQKKRSLRIVCDTCITLVGLELARGLGAARRRESSGPVENMPSWEAYRRPTTGVLRNFSLKNLASVGPTTMEPELALLMSSPSGVHTSKQARARVLDPFAGSCALLVAAALGCSRSTHLTGLDSAMGSELDLALVLENFRKILRDDSSSSAQSLPLGEQVSLYHGKAQWLVSPPRGRKVTAHLQPGTTGQPRRLCGSWDTLFLDCTDDGIGTFDAIITDPPYNMKEKWVGAQRETESAEGGTAVDAFRTLLDISANRLVHGGRLVCFFPEKISSDFRSERPLSLPQLPECLEMKLSLRQVLSKTFSRWLLVISKTKSRDILE
jgi:16S rRNA G966 N2-methylase RsmD